MFANQRYDEILNILTVEKAVKTADLVKHFNVSIETIRRDLLELENKGLLQRVHGGAVAPVEMRKFSDLSHRLEENREGKKALCETAAMLVNNRDIIMIDSGSTAVHFAEALKKKSINLTVVTHSIDVFNILNSNDNFNIILTGGHFLKKENSFYGQLALDMLKNIHVQKAFIFPYAISLNNGICDFTQELFQMQKQMIKCADKLFFLADSDKFEKNALMKLSDMKDSYTYITDSNLSPAYKKLYEENNINIITGKEDIK